MQKRSICVSVILVLISMISCTSYFSFKMAENAYTRGDYSEAVFVLTDSLRRDPDQPKAIALLQEAFPLAVSKNLECARSHQVGNASFKWSGAADCLIRLHMVNDAVRSLPPLYNKKEDSVVKFETVYYHRQLAEAREKAAEEQYVAGLSAASEHNSADQKKAHRYFLKALYYVPDYKDASLQASRSLEAATTRVSVLPTIDRSHFYRPVNTSALLYNTLLTQLSQGAAGKTYTRIIDRGNLDEILAEQQLAVSDLIDSSTALRVGGLMGANRIVVTEILDIHYDPPEVTVTTMDRRAEIPLENSDSAGENVKIPIRLVKGTFILFEKRTKLSLNVIYKLIDLETSELVTGDVVNKVLEDSASWGDYEGDEEAMSAGDRKILARGEKDVLSLADLLTISAREAGEEIAGRILKQLD